MLLICIHIMIAWKDYILREKAAIWNYLLVDTARDAR